MAILKLRIQSKLKHCCLFKTTARFRATNATFHWHKDTANLINYEIGGKGSTKT